MFYRPCFLIMDREHAGSLSTRKLVLESAKLNVLSVHSSGEAVETLRRFPKVDGILLDGGALDMPIAELVSLCQEIAPHAPVVVIGSGHEGDVTGADYYLESFAPAELLKLVSTLRPKEVEAIARGEEEKQRREHEERRSPKTSLERS